jgi:hypothetical protein
MEATVAAQSVMEKITALAGKSSDDSFDDDVSKLDGCLVVDAKDDLFVYHADYDAQIYIDRVSEPVSHESPVSGMNIYVVVFYNNGSSYVQTYQFLKTG